MTLFPVKAYLCLVEMIERVQFNVKTNMYIEMLNPFTSIFPFSIPWKHHKTGGFLMFISLLIYLFTYLFIYLFWGG